MLEMAETYPGSKKKRRDTSAPDKKGGSAKRPEGWDKRPTFKSFNGQVREFFYRGALAAALNRKVVTIRAMTASGVICNPAIQDGHDRWLYSRDQIEDMITLAIEEGVIEPRRGVRFSPRFIEEAHKILSRVPE